MTPPPVLDTGRMLAFDLETTGPDPADALVVTSALVRIDGSDVDSRTWLADPGIEIPEGATAVHGITTAQAREHGRPHAEVVSETITGIREGWRRGLPLVVFNAPYDLSILHRLDPGFTAEGPVLDPYVIDRALDTYRRGPRTLTAMCEHHGVRIDKAHDAGADAVAAARLLWKLARVHPTLTTTPLDELMALQARWHRERQEDFAEYLRRNGRSADEVDGSWPIRGA